MNDDQKITYFGLTNFRNQERKFGIKKIDRRKHMYIVGKTGMGKTTLLENLAMQDIQNGEGVCFIDPHGDTAYRLLDFVPKERMNDVIYFNPADLDFPIGLNVMESVDPARRHFVASGLMSVFKKIFGPDVWSARMEYILGNTISALLEYPESTLLSINPMLSVKDFRKKVVDNVKDPVVKAFWTQEFAKYTERFAAEATPAIQNKVGQFTSNPLIRNILGQKKSTFDFRKAMDERKIIIVNLAKGLVGEDNMRLLGTMIITKIYIAAMSRVDIEDESKRKDFFLYVDEFQNFATESFRDILSEARKYHLNLIMANQYMKQLSEEVHDAVIGNVGTMLTFRVGADDAEFLEKEFGPEFMATDIVNLGFAQIYLKLMIDGIASRPFSSLTLPPIKNEQRSFKADILEVSRKNYATPRAVVEEGIHRWTDEMIGESVVKETRIESGFRPTRGADDAPARPQVPMYDAICIVCGKKTQVPFQPDPTRPVFCKEHIGMAAKYPKRLAQQQIAIEGTATKPPFESAPIRPIKPADGEPVMKQSVDEKPKTLSLKDLSQHTAGITKKPYAREPMRAQKQDHLSALREALKKSQDTKKTSSPQSPTSAPVNNNTVPAPMAAPPVSDQNTGTLKPGESIRL